MTCYNNNAFDTVKEDLLLIIYYYTNMKINFTSFFFYFNVYIFNIIFKITYLTHICGLYS